MKLAIVALLALAAPPAHADCARSGLAVRLMPASSKLPSDGGIVVITEAFSGRDLEPGDPALVPGWKWKAGGKLVVRSLAPGLAVIETPAAGELLDGKGVSQLSITTVNIKSVPLGAPKPLEIVHTKRDSRRSSEEVTVRFATAPPLGALAIVLLDDAGPKSWQLIGPRSPVVAAYSQIGCLALPNGTRPTQVGDLVKVAFVDNYGRMSPASPAFKVQAKPSLRAP